MRCPNTLQEFSLEQRGKPCVTCEDLGQIPGCLGLDHPNVHGMISSIFSVSNVIIINYSWLLPSSHFVSQCSKS